MASNISYIVPRDPSIIAPGIRPLPASRKNLFSILNDIKEAEDKNPVEVYLRIKPSLAEATTDGFLKPSVPESTMYQVDEEKKVLVTRHHRQTSHGKQEYTHRYNFTEIFSAAVEQKELFQRCVRDLVRDFIAGRNALLFAYGTTNAGKTYTMIGDNQRPGVVPRSISMLFNAIRTRLSDTCRLKPHKVAAVVELEPAEMEKEERFKQDILHWNSQYAESTHVSKSMFSQTGSEDDSRRLGLSLMSDDSEFVSWSFREMQGRLHDDTACSLPSTQDSTYTVWVSFAEIYNESVFDLLEPPPAKGGVRRQLYFGTDAQHHVYIKDLRHVCVRSGDEAYQAMLYGRHNLRCAPTSLNHSSSRSHCIFTIKLVRSHVDCADRVKLSTFSFCDLAGSERTKKTNNVGERFRETQNINSSLMTLGRCLSSIRDNQKLVEKKPVPYRESKLTRLFQRSLSGSDRVAMLVNVSTQPELFSETYNVLGFSAIALQVVLVPVARPRREKKKASRFSIMADSKSRSTIAWDIAEEEGEERRDSAAALEHSAATSRLVAQLRAQLLAEQARNQTLETDLRAELCDKFSVMLKDSENLHKTRIAACETRYEEMLDWRVERMQEYYEEKLKICKSHKRKRTSDDDEDEADNEEEDDKLDPALLASRVTALQADLDALQQELGDTRQLNVEAVRDNDALRVENSRLTFELAAAKQTLETLSQTGDDKWNQLNEELRAEVTSQQRKIENMKMLLDEAKQDFQTLKGDNEALEVEIQEQENHLALKELDSDKQATALLECRQLLSEQTETLEAKELELTRELADMVARAERAEEKEKELREELASLRDHNETMSSKSSSLEGDCTRKEQEVLQLEGEVKRLLQEQRARDNEMNDLQRELKDTVKAMASAEQELEVEQERRKRAEMQWQCEVRSVQTQLRDLQDSRQHVSEREHEKLLLELATLQEENTALVADKASFEERRDKQFQLYEDMLKKERDTLKKEREDKERQKHEVKGLQEVLYLHTPTPKKNEEIVSLKEDLRLKDLEINKLTAQMKSMNVHKSKENKMPTPVSTRRQTRKKDLMKSPAAVCDAPPPHDATAVAASKSDKRVIKKKLFVQTDDVVLLTPDDTKETETYTATPAEIMKRSLRTRRN